MQSDLIIHHEDQEGQEETIGPAAALMFSFARSNIFTALCLIEPVEAEDA